MKGPRLVGLVALATMLGVTQAADKQPAAQKPPASQPRPSVAPKLRQIACLLRITGHPSLLGWLKPWTIDDVVQSPAVLDKSLEELGLSRKVAKSPGFRVGLLSSSWTPGRGDGGKQPSSHSTLFVRFVVELPPDVDPIAYKLLMTVRKNLEALLRGEAISIRSLMAERIEERERELARAEQELHAVLESRRELPRKAGRSDLRRDAVLDEIRQLESQRRQLEMNHAALEARRKAVLTQIQDTAEKAKAKAKDDPVAKELEKIVAIRLEAIERLHKMPKEVLARDELSKAQAVLAEAKARLAQRREETARSAGNQLLEQLNAELASLSLDTAENEARLVFITRQLAEIKASRLLDLVDAYERIVNYELPICRQRVQHWRKTWAELRFEAGIDTTPTVTVVGFP